MAKADITVIVNGHREKLLSVATLKSVASCIDYANSYGIKTEVIAVLDLADAITQNVFQDWVSKRKDATILNVQNGDLGLSRNMGVEKARGEWIAFIDGDDLWDKDWLVKAYQAASKDNRDIVWHPNTNLHFGSNPHIFLHPDMEDPDIEIERLAYQNLWSALCFTSRSILKRIPYRLTHMDKQIGYEDWSWNIETIANGILHKTVPDTVHAIRGKHVSLVKQTSASLCIPHPSDLFLNLLSKEPQKSNINLNE
jgi:glycosyltransferase involved in cell wall biosynthesis